jgi:hypothetical protein
MKFLAILVLLYVGLGFFVTTELLARFDGVPDSAIEKPPFQTPLIVLLMGLLLALPVVGMRRASKQGTFLRCGPRIWAYVPASLLLTGILGSLAFRALDPRSFRDFVTPGRPAPARPR